METMIAQYFGPKPQARRTSRVENQSLEPRSYEDPMKP